MKANSPNAFQGTEDPPPKRYIDDPPPEARDSKEVF
jgi:hypothetical protein